MTRDQINRIVEDLDNGRLDEAHVQLQAWLERDAPNPEAWCLLARCRYLQKDWQAALYAVEHATALAPRSARAWYWATHILLAAGYVEKAGQALDIYNRYAVPREDLDKIGTGIVWLNAPQLDLATLDYARLSYANAGQDQVIAKYMKRKLAAGTPGTYVDIGAYRAVLLSNTYFFYVMGWSGVCIDINDAFAADYGAVRPRDEFVSAAIGADGAAAYVARHAENYGMTAIRSDPKGFGPSFGPPARVQLQSLKSILERRWPDGHEIDFFSVDVEGAEEMVMRSNDWTKFRPHLICVEDHAYRCGAAGGSPTTHYLEQVGYRVDGKVHGDVILIDERWA